MIEKNLSSEELRIIEELRKIRWGKLTIVIKEGKVTLVTPAPDIRLDIKPTE